MGELITATREFLLEFLEANQYLALAIYVGVEEAGVPFPVPADTAIVLMGYQVYRGVANPVAVVATVVVSATGRRLGAVLAGPTGRPSPHYTVRARAPHHTGAARTRRALDTPL